MRTLALVSLTASLTVLACSDAAPDTTEPPPRLPIDDAGPNPTVDSATETGAQTDAGGEAPKASVQTGVTTASVPQALADDASVFVLADDTVVFLLFTTPPTSGNLWSGADQSAVSAFRAAAASLKAGNVALLPPSRLLRADLPRSFAADAAPGSCVFLGTTNPCVLDPSTKTVHVPPGQLTKWNGVDRKFIGPNVAGGMLTLSKIDVQSDAIVLYGKSANPGKVFDQLVVHSANSPAADAGGFVPVKEPFNYDFSGKTLYAQGPVTLSIKSGHVAAIPSFKTDLHMNGLTLTDTNLAVKGDVDIAAELALDVSASVAANFKKDFSVTLFEMEAPLPTMMIGPIPVPQAVKATVAAYCSIEASATMHVTAGASFHQSLTVGGSYANGAFQNASSIGTPALTAIGPSMSGKATTLVGCGVVLHFSILYFGVIGPYVSVAAAASFNGAYVPPSLKWGLGGAVVGTAAIEGSIKLPGFGPVNDILSAAIPKKETTLFSKSFTLGSGTVP